MFTHPDITENSLTQVIANGSRELTSALTLSGNAFFRNLDTDTFNGDGTIFEECVFGDDEFLVEEDFTDVNAALLEAYRVLKPGGKFICLEFSKVNDYFLQKIYDAYSFKVIPKIGEVILKDRASYQYLVESIRKFPSQDEFKKMISSAGFKNVSYQNLSFGAAAIHVGIK